MIVADFRLFIYRLIIFVATVGSLSQLAATEGYKRAASLPHAVLIAQCMRQGGRNTRTLRTCTFLYIMVVLLQNNPDRQPLLQSSYVVSCYFSTWRNTLIMFYMSQMYVKFT